MARKMMCQYNMKSTKGKKKNNNNNNKNYKKKKTLILHTVR